MKLMPFLHSREVEKNLYLYGKNNKKTKDARRLVKIWILDLTHIMIF